MDETTYDHADTTGDMTDDEKRRDQLLAAPGAVESDADPRIEVSEHNSNTRIDIAEDAAVRPGNPYNDPDDGSLEGPDIETPTGAGDDAEGTPKPGGLGQDGTIPPDPDGVAAGHTGEMSNFNPEEDEDAPA